MKRLYEFLKKLIEGSWILLIVIMAVSTSCEKNVLDTEPLNNFSDASVWKDENLIKAFINLDYQLMPFPLNDNSASNFGYGCAVDELYSRGGTTNYLVDGSLNPTQTGPLNVWEGNSYGKNPAKSTTYWPIINDCNLFFSKIKDSPISESVKQEMMGQMYFLRAYSYFGLVRGYGGVPLFTTPFGLNDNFELPRNTLKECMDFVISGLDSAAMLLPLEWPDKEKGRVTKGAALAIKSRALLFMASPLNNPSGDVVLWQKAADAAKAVIDLQQYELYPDYRNIFVKANSYNSEVIWSRPFNYVTNPEAAYLELLNFPNGYRGNGQKNPIQNCVDQFPMINGELPILGYENDSIPIVNPASGYDPQNPYVNRDPRFYDCILHDGAPFQGREVETFYPDGKDSNQGTAAPWNASQTGYYMLKFMDESIVNPNPTNNGNSPWIFIRYAEVLLNYAEAQYHLGNEDVCREYINMIRSRPSVNMPLVTASGELLVKALQQENYVEFVFEGHRFFDLRRWKIAPEVLNTIGRRIEINKDTITGEKTYKIIAFNPMVFHERNYWVPIPQNEIEKNGKLEQNPGYNVK